MGFLDRFKPQPKWKHPDATVRAAAVEALASDDQDALGAVALEDPEPAVRRVALGRIDNPAVLARIAREDGDEAVRAEAAELLMGVAQDSTNPDEAQLALETLTESRALAIVARHAELEPIAMAALGRLSEPRVVSVVARQAGHASVRMAALARLHDREEYLAVATKSEHKDVALAALEHLAERDDLEAVATRARNKAVARRSRSMLRALDEADRVPRLQAARRVELCEAVERLARAQDLEGLTNRLALVEVEWEELASGADGETGQRFAAAVTGIRQRLAQTEAERAEHDRRVQGMKEDVSRAASTRAALCERVEGLEGEGAPSGLDEVRTLWVALAPWPEATRDGVQARELDQRFARACADCEGRIARHVERERRRGEFEAVLVQARAAAALEDLRAARTAFADARQLWSRLRVEAAPEEVQSQELKALEQQIVAREASVREARERDAQANLKRIERLVERAEAAVGRSDLSLRDAERLVRDLKSVMEHTGFLPTRRDHDAAVERLKRIHAALFPKLQELREAEDWRRWANASVQEELCLKAEALKEVVEPAEVARHLQLLQAEWRNSGAVPRDRVDQLWQRFKTACDEARQRCEGYFKEQREIELANLRQKEVICARAEALADSTDWIRTAEEMKQLQAEWQQVGPVPREQNQVLWGRFRAACDRFFTRRKDDLSHRKAEWSENLKRKEALCARVEELAASTNWDAAVGEVKRLQAEWKAIGPVKRNKSEAIWQRFRSGCDAFFERYKNRDQLAMADVSATREALCAEIEAMAPALASPGPTDPPPDVEAKVIDLWQRWTASPRLPRPASDQLNERFDAAFTRVVETWPERFRGTRLDVSSNRRRMEQLCERVERAVDEAGRTTDIASAPPEALASLLKNALAANTIGGRVDEEAKRRAAVTAVREAQSSWRRIGPVPGEEGRALAARFHRACRRFFEGSAPQPGAPRPRQP